MIKEYIKYLQDNPHGYWFKRKLYGWGWTPATWQGWLTLFLFVTLVVFFSLTIDRTSSKSEVFFTFFLPVLLLTVTFIRICYKKGEAPKWQWGIPGTKYDGTIGRSNKIIILYMCIVTIIFGLGGYLWVQKLTDAHSSFEKYYTFRGCEQLLEKTDTYAKCSLKNGEIIKLVNVNDKWFLDGDLGW